MSSHSFSALTTASALSRASLSLLVSTVLLATQFAFAQPASRLLSNEIAQLDPVMEESSGLALHEDMLWTHNDSGDQARLFQLDLQGELQRQVVVSNAENVDWESMAQDGNYLYIADTGNNANTRAELTIYRVAWQDLSADEVNADIIKLRYEDYAAGNRMSHNFDAEGLTVKGNELWLFSKNRGNQHSTLYRFPKLPGSYTAAPSQSLPVNALVTAADIHPVTGRLVLIMYRGSAGNFLWSADTDNNGVVVATASEIEISPADQWEALAFDAENDKRLYLTHESNTRGYAGLAWVILD